MNIGLLYKDLVIQLSAAYTHRDEVCQVAWWFLEAAMQMPRVRLETLYAEEVTESQKVLLEKWVYDHVYNHKPLQYIIGNVPFLDFSLIVEPPLLIPRPETEEWIAWLIGRLNTVINESITIVDVGTGSGCIAIALARALPRARVYAVDVSRQACMLAQKNCAHNGVQNVHCIESNLLSALENIKPDLIVSNPPYITEIEYGELSRSVVDWEDKNALVSSGNGLACIYELAQQAYPVLNKQSVLVDHGIAQFFVEIGYKQGAAVSELMKDIGYNNPKVWVDSCGRDRVVYAGQKK